MKVYVIEKVDNFTGRYRGAVSAFTSKEEAEKELKKLNAEVRDIFYYMQEVEVK